MYKENKTFLKAQAFALESIEILAAIDEPEGKRAEEYKEVIDNIRVVHTKRIENFIKYNPDQKAITYVA